MREHAHQVPCVVGRMYLVPCMKVSRCAAAYFAPPDGWLPVLGPKHQDAEHLEFPWEHFHIDWRFIGDDEFAYACAPHGVPHSTVLTNDQGQRGKLIGSPVLKARKCRRLMPEFPQVEKVNFTRPGVSAQLWARLEIAQAFTCNKLKTGNICPHRGIDLTPFAQPDGTAVCPGHGLRWNLKTGELLPRHGMPA